VHRIVSESQLVRMARGRPQNEFAVGFGMEIDGLVRRRENNELASLHGLGNGKASRGERSPKNAVIGRRLVTPGLAGFQAHGEIVHRRRRRERAGRGAVSADENPSRAVARDILRRLVDAFYRSELMVRGKRDPQLEPPRADGPAWNRWRRWRLILWKVF
jgi:hypothetical protein